MKINIIGDIAGRYDELILLLAKMPEADLVISVGDMVDRGRQSKQVLEWFMKTPNAKAIYGNHEDMMVKYCENPYDWNNRMMWLHNGGHQTLESFRAGLTDTNIPIEELVDPVIVEWIKALPLYFINEELVISHGPIQTEFDELPDQYSKHNHHYFIWNRMPPHKRVSNKLFHVYGHNGEIKHNTDSIGTYATCIDNSWHGELTGMHWPTQEIFRQEYLKKEID